MRKPRVLNRHVIDFTRNDKQTNPSTRNKQSNIRWCLEQFGNLGSESRVGGEGEIAQIRHLRQRRQRRVRDRDATGENKAGGEERKEGKKERKRGNRVSPERRNATSSSNTSDNYRHL